MKHPVSYIGDIIEFFEEKFYKDSVYRGLLLVLFVLAIVSFFVFSIIFYLELINHYMSILVSAILASMFLAHKMLHDSVKKVILSKDKKDSISMLVSRDTKDMNESDINKASIETYAENLSDGVIAPLFYLVFFGLGGVVLYKAVNTMDSMVGYRNEHYENFGKVAARLDDILNYIPSRITAVLIMILYKQKNIFAFYQDGKKHDSPNAGHPITAMALSLNLKLGGDTSYFGKIKKKASFGNAKTEITTDDVYRAIGTKIKIDLFVLIFLALACFVVRIY